LAASTIDRRREGPSTRSGAAAAAGAIDQERAKVVFDAGEERRHEVGGVAVVALENDDGASLAVIDDVERVVLHTNMVAIGDSGRVTWSGPSPERE